MRLADLKAAIELEDRLAEKQGHVAIFLAKNWLGMADRQEVTGEAGGPITFKVKYDDSD